MNALVNATSYLTDLKVAEDTLLRQLGIIRAEKEKVETFFELFERFNFEPRRADGQAAEYAEVTPAAAGSVTAEEVAPNASSAPVPEAPKPPPDAPDIPADAVEQPADAMTSAEEPSADGSGGMQDRCESIPPSDQEPAVDSPADAPSSEAAVGNEADPPAPEPTMRERVKALHAAHPEYTRRQAWETLGISEGSLAGHGHALGIKWAPAVQQVPPPSPKAEEQPETIPEAKFAPRHGDDPPRIAKPKGTRFRLRAGKGEGKWLHMSGVGLTDKKFYAWVGTEAQLTGVRSKFADARDLYEEIVEKEEVRA